MRRCSFRGKRIDNGEWTYGYLAEIETDWDFYNGHGLPIEYSKVIIETNLLTRPMTIIIPETIGQYTGLKDKNSTKIYEGDIVQAYNGINKIIGVVKFGEYKQDGSSGEYNPVSCTGFYVKRIRTIPNRWETKDDLMYEPDYSETTSIQSYKWVEIIGNIHENPELLGVEQ